MNLNDIDISIKINIDDDGIERLKNIIIKKGGTYWDKKGKRVYFNREIIDGLYDFGSLPIPISHLYFDIQKKSLEFKVGSEDHKKYDEKVFKPVIINTLRPRITK